MHRMRNERERRKQKGMYNIEAKNRPNGRTLTTKQELEQTSDLFPSSPVCRSTRSPILLFHWQLYATGKIQNPALFWHWAPLWCGVT